MPGMNRSRMRSREPIIPGSSTDRPASAGIAATTSPPCFTRISPSTLPTRTGALTRSTSATYSEMSAVSPRRTSRLHVPPLTAGTLSCAPSFTGTSMPS